MSDNILLEARREGDARYTLRTSAVAFAEGAQFAMTHLAALTPSPAPSAAPHQGADALREAAESLFEAVRVFRNEPKLEKLIGLRSTEGYGGLVKAWDDYADARAALAHHQAPQQGEQQ